MLSLKKAFAAGGGYLALISCALAQICDQSAAIEEIADNVFVRPGRHGVAFRDRDFANIGFIVGRDCVAVIDTGGSPREGRELRCAIQQTTAIPVCYLIITHHHFDHVLGNSAFSGDDVTIIAHEKLAASLSASAGFYRSRLAPLTDAEQAYGDIIVFPDRTIAAGETATLDLGDRLLLLQAHATAHTNNDLSVFDRRSATLWLSDLLFVDHIPTLDGSLTGWLDELAKAMQTVAAKAVPGHGPPAVSWPEGGVDERRYLLTLRDQARALIARDGNLDEAQATIAQEEKSRWQMFEHHHRRNVIRAVTELEWE